MARTTSYSSTALTHEMLFLPLKHKIYIFSPPCNILYIHARHVLSRSNYLWPPSGPFQAVGGFVRTPRTPLAYGPVPFNFERLEQHHYQSNRKSNISAVLEKDESFKLGTFHQDLSYHSNEMTPCLILHKTE